ncbi:MAG: 50S ribosomal protein L4, partial [Elusimicrobiaceae bacterium]|nr:50S ribosomal protein L4 [Elusimicrobiaceae bacterium]
SPIWRHGGVAFGPTPRSFRIDLPAAKRRLALAQALTSKYTSDNVLVLENFDLKEAKTKAVAEVLKTLSAGKKPLLVTSKDAKLDLASRNIAGLNKMVPTDLNAYVVLNSTKVIFTKEAIEKLAK